MTSTDRSSEPVFRSRTSIATAVVPGTVTVVVSSSRPGSSARRTTRSGRHSCVTGAPYDLKIRPSTKATAVVARPWDTGGNWTAVTEVRSWSTRTVPRWLVRPAGAIMSS